MSVAFICFQYGRTSKRFVEMSVLLIFCSMFSPKRWLVETSGITIDDDCVKVYNDLKNRKLWRYIIYRISDDFSTIIVEEKASRGKCFNDFVESLKRAEALRQCRFAVYDVKCHYNNVLRERLVFYLWSPENASIKQKMLYSSSERTLREKLVGISSEIQSTHDTELSYKYILEQCGEK